MGDEITFVNYLMNLIMIYKFSIEIGAVNYGFDLDEIIGLDLLQKVKAVININN